MHLVQYVETILDSDHTSKEKKNSTTCRPRCICKAGHVRLTSSDDSECVRPTVCPCHHAGKSYGEGAFVKRTDECKTW